MFGYPIDTINIKNSCHITHGIKLLLFLEAILVLALEATVLTPPQLPALPSFVETNTIIQKGDYLVISH